MILLSISKWMLGAIIVLMDVKGRSSCKSSNDICQELVWLIRNLLLHLIFAKDLLELI